jgi:hypothetical protein
MLSIFAAVLACGGALAQERPPIEATTSSGEKVLLHPNGRWEYLDAAKQVEAKRVADTYPENQQRGPHDQGGWLFGRTIKPGDPEYNRGSLSGKGR